MLIPLILLAPAVIWRHQLADLLAPTQPASRVRARSAAPRRTPASAPEAVEGFGTARAYVYPRISAAVAGEVIDVPLRRGMTVKKGQMLVRLDDAEYRQHLAQTQGALDAQRILLEQLDIERSNCEEFIRLGGDKLRILEKELERVIALQAEGNATPREINEKTLDIKREEIALLEHKARKSLFATRQKQLEADCRKLDAEVELARRNAAACIITAPCDGAIAELRVQVGERVQPHDELLSLLDPARIEVTVELPVDVREMIRPGAACRMFRESTGAIVWRGTVERISPESSASEQTFKLYVDVDNSAYPNTPLVHGYAVRAVVAVGNGP